MSDPAVAFRGVGKMYKVHDSRAASLLDALGLPHPLRRRRHRSREFWALRGIDLQVARGERLGVIGRNGAGKTTLLKLVTQNLPPTEGVVEVNGDVQALLEIGGGLHPEFTGVENIRAALAYAGLSPAQLRAAEEDIAEFTELGDFLHQPFKTYSLGMQSRLSFAIATTATPEILIIDEVLGAGDAYFFTKSSERMRRLIEGGASVLLVSHALDQIVRFCDDAVWLERGQIVERGPSIEVVKAYERFIRDLENRRLTTRNRQRQARADTAAEDDEQARSIVVRFRVDADAAGELDVGRVALHRSGELVEAVQVGAPQDADATHGGFTMLDESDWSSPMRENGAYWRRLETGVAGRPSQGSVALVVPEVGREFELAVAYRSLRPPNASLEIWLEETCLDRRALDPTSQWTSVRVPVTLDEPLAGTDTLMRAGLSHWPAAGGLAIDEVVLEDETRRPCAVFVAGSPLHLRVSFHAEHEGEFRLLPAAVAYRLDGVNAFTVLGDWVSLQARAEARCTAELSLDSLNLGDGTYLVSVVLYKDFDPHLHHPPIVYDWIDRSVELKVIGTPPAITSIFIHPGQWDVRG